MKNKDIMRFMTTNVDRKTWTDRHGDGTRIRLKKERVKARKNKEVFGWAV